MAVLDGNTIGDVGERRRALIGGNDQIRIIVIAPDGIFRRHDFRILDVVGDIQHSGNEGLVACDALFYESFASTARRRLFDYETAL